MSVINGYTFDGPYLIEGTNFSAVPGVYVIHTNGIWLDVGETDNLKERIANHERRNSWIYYASGNQIFLSFYHDRDLNNRLSVESQLRTSLCPTCGDR